MEHTTDYTLNVTEFPTRKIPKIWKPSTLDELRQIVMDANEDRRAIYPISTGHNWGLGSKMPVQDAEVIDLRMLDNIVEVNEELCYARIQPGVTQRQLSDYLNVHHPSLMLNVTGSDAHSSILGNTLERGSGKNGHRASDLRAVRVLLADGSTVASGYDGISGNEKCFYSYGLGPDITHLFTQSNYGIVTEGVINLMVKQPFDLFLAKVPHSNLKNFFTSFSSTVRKGLIGNTLELDSQNDPKIFELFRQEQLPDEKFWVGWFVIYGEGAVLRAKTDQLREELSTTVSDLKIYSSEERYTDVPVPVQVRLERYSGIPSDHSLLATAKSFGVELDESNPDIDMFKDMPGFRCVLPVLPFSGEASEILDFILDFSRDLDFDPAISVIGLDPYSLEVFCRVHFDRNDESQIASASKWSSELLSALKTKGIYSYRLDIETMKHYLESLEDPGLEWKKSIKELFDPKGILAPGRYII